MTEGERRRFGVDGGWRGLVVDDLLQEGIMHSLDQREK